MCGCARVYAHESAVGIYIYCDARLGRQAQTEGQTEMTTQMIQLDNSYEIICRGGRTGTKLHISHEGSSTAQCGHWFKANCINFKIEEATDEAILRSIENFCSKCIGEFSHYRIATNLEELQALREARKDVEQLGTPEDDAAIASVMNPEKDSTMATTAERELNSRLDGDLEASDVKSIRMWYNRQERSWVVYPSTSEADSTLGIQAGESTYIGSGKDDALDVAIGQSHDFDSAPVIHQQTTIIREIDAAAPVATDDSLGLVTAAKGDRQITVVRKVVLEYHYTIGIGDNDSLKEAAHMAVELGTPIGADSRDVSPKFDVTVTEEGKSPQTFSSIELS